MDEKSAVKYCTFTTYSIIYSEDPITVQTSDVTMIFGSYGAIWLLAIPFHW